MQGFDWINFCYPVDVTITTTAQSMSLHFAVGAVVSRNYVIVFSPRSREFSGFADDL